LRERLMLAIGWMVIYIYQVALPPLSIAAYSQIPPDHYLPDHWPLVLVCGYLVPLAMILLRPTSTPIPRPVKGAPSADTASVSTS
jgi:hypothetical protein